MLTVLRILAAPAEIDDLKRVIGAIDTRHASSEMEWRSPRGDGYVVDLCDAPIWFEHYVAILRFVDDNREALRLVRATGASLTIDVALYSEDVEDQLMLEVRFPEDVLDALAAVSVELVVSLYAMGPDPSDRSLARRLVRRLQRLP